MSRSNPNVNASNPAVRWFEWNGEKGNVRYYDKDKKENVDVVLPFTFLLLDELASVRGWDDASESGIYSNEVRDTTKDVLVVKSFKGGTIAEGYYKAIKDRVNTRGASFVANCYIATKINDVLTLCSLRFKGSALGAWMEFRKAQRSGLYDSAVRITGFTEGKKGRITFRMPAFELKATSPETNDAALALDEELQTFLTAYLQRKTRDQADTPTDSDDSDSAQDESGYTYDNNPNRSQPLTDALTDDDIPF